MTAVSSSPADVELEFEALIGPLERVVVRHGHVPRAHAHDGRVEEVEPPLRDHGGDFGTEAGSGYVPKSRSAVPDEVTVNQ